MELPTRDEIVDAIKIYKKAAEANEWRPIAQYVVDLVKLYVKKNKMKSSLERLEEWLDEEED